MRVALAILVRASGCPIIWTPPVGTHAESSEDEDRAASIAPCEPPPNGIEQVVVNDRIVEGIVSTPPARPFFAEVGAERWWEYPQGALATRPLSEDGARSMSEERRDSSRARAHTES
jgi:hypothetical protein